jgi:methylmalonyl-CoA mutase N-terminal domain/subunit
MSAYKYQKDIETNSKVVVGVNKFQNQSTGDTPILKIDDSIRELQIEKLKRLKANRDEDAAKRSLTQIQEAARSTENLMPLVIEAVECHCTLGEIADTLRSVFGEYRQ